MDFSIDPKRVKATQSDREWQKQVITNSGTEVIARAMDSQLTIEIPSVYIGYYPELERLQIADFESYLKNVTTLPAVNKIATILSKTIVDNKTLITIQIDNVGMDQRMQYNSIITMIKNQSGQSIPYAISSIKTTEELLSQSQPVQLQFELITTISSDLNINIAINPDLQADRVIFKSTEIQAQEVLSAIKEVNNNFKPHPIESFLSNDGVHNLKYNKTSNGFAYKEGNNWHDIDLVGGDVTTLNNKINTHKQNVTNLTNTVNDEKAKLSRLSTTVETKQRDLTNLTTRVDTLKADVTTLSTNLNTLKRDVSDLSNTATTLTNDIASNTQNIRDHEQTNINAEQGVHGVRYYNNRVQVNTTGGWVVAFNHGFPPKNVSDIGVLSTGKMLTVTWSDPSDLIVHGAVMSRWRGTKVVYKTGEYPQNPNDGTLVVDNTTKDRYRDNGIEIPNLVNGTTYYISFFPYSTEDVYNYDEGNRVTGVPTANIPDPVTRVKVEPRGSKKLDIQYVDPENRRYATWQKTRVVFKENSTPENPEDGRWFESTRKNQYANGVGALVSRMTNDTPYYFRFYVYTREGGVNDTVVVTATPKNIPETLSMTINKNEANTNTRCRYTGNLANIPVNDPKIDTFIGHYPVLLKDGREVARIDPNNYMQTIDGDAINPDGSEGDWMVAFPRRSIKIKTVGSDNPQITMSMGDNSEGFDILAHKRGDVIKDKFYAGVYMGTELDGKIRSLPQKTIKHSIKIQHAIDKCQANGAGYEMFAFYQLTYLQVCYLLKYKNCNSQAAVGKGIIEGGVQSTGGTETRGMDWGTQTGTDHVKCLGIEDLWGNFFQYIPGISILTNGKLVATTDNFNSTADGYFETGYTVSNNLSGYAKFVIGETNKGFLVSNASGSDSTYYPDKAIMWKHNTETANIVYGGYPGWGDEAGIFNMRLNYNTNKSGNDIACRLMYL